MTNPEKVKRTFWRCAECKEIYRYKGTAEYCCSPEEKEKYGE